MNEQKYSSVVSKSVLIHITMKSSAGKNPATHIKNTISRFQKFCFDFTGSDGVTVHL